VAEIFFGAERCGDRQIKDLSVPAGLKSVIIVSACLLGFRTRYDGKTKADPTLLSLWPEKIFLPVPPEQLGGLPTPRPPAEIIGGDGLAVWEGKARVINRAGEDVTQAFLKGAEEVLRVVRILGVRKALLKSRSPSCGLNPKLGVTAARLLAEGLRVEEWG